MTDSEELRRTGTLDCANLGFFFVSSSMVWLIGGVVAVVAIAIGILLLVVGSLLLVSADVEPGFRIEPTGPQREEALARIANARRFVWNWGLDQRRQHYAITGKSLLPVDLSRRLTELKQQPEMAWLKDADFLQIYANPVCCALHHKLRQIACPLPPNPPPPSKSWQF